jgi:hypothetical protein
MSVVAFPFHRRRDLVSGVARVLGNKHGEDANTYWRRTAKRLLRLAMGMGLERQAAEDEIRALLHAVLREIQHNALMPAVQR